MVNNGFIADMEGGDDDNALLNLGVKLNEAKKLKRAKMLEEQALQAQLGVEQATKPEDTRMPDAPPEPTRAPSARAKTPKPNAPTEQSTQKKSTEQPAQKKRKRESTPPPAAPAPPDATATDLPDAPASARSAPQPKKLKLSIPAPPAGNNTSSDKAPAASASSPIKATGPAISSPRTRPRSSRASAVPESTTAPHSATSARPSTRLGGTSITLKASKAASAEPPNRRESLRRGSNASLPAASSPKSEAAAPGAGRPARRSKRPAPGLIMADEDGSTKVSRAKRKAAPKKKEKGAPAAATSKDRKEKEESAFEEEYIDPDEPRYCICDNVSYGDMIACDNEPVSCFSRCPAFSSRQAKGVR